MGEELTVQCLKQRGYTVLERNYRKPWGEIDVVAKLNGVLHFIEVKSTARDVTRETSAFGPEDHMNFGKRERQKRIIETYLIDRKISEDIDWQIDLACVFLDQEGNLEKIDILEDYVL